ncbi:hypothetical protein [uncultured Campylobacter sp.]|nr:hypothetical protein [uncultured Campylobacter sp.]
MARSNLNALDFRACAVRERARKIYQIYALDACVKIKSAPSASEAS